MKFLKGKPKQYFENALAACFKDKTLTYVEGITTLRFSAHHAWATTADGEIVECTLPRWLAKGQVYTQGITLTRLEVVELYLTDGDLPIMSEKEVDELSNRPEILQIKVGLSRAQHSRLRKMTKSDQLRRKKRQTKTKSSKVTSKCIRK
jgi:hypothetical protein